MALRRSLFVLTVLWALGGTILAEVTWHLEGHVEGVTTGGVLRLDCTGSQQGGIGAMAFSRQDFPDNIVIEYDLVIEQTNGLLIAFVAMQGTNGEDAITGVPPRTGVFDDYTGPNASTRSYHVSVCRYDDKGVHTGVSNWRRNPGLNLMTSGKDLCTETGKTYHVAITKKGPACEIRVNGEPGASFVDPQTLPGPIPTAGRIGFRAIGSKAVFRISNFKVTPTVTIKIDASKPVGTMTPIWRFFGADEPNFAYMKDGRKLLDELGRLAPRSVYFRTHNLLTSGDGTPALKWGSTGAYIEDAAGKPVYNWTILDRIFDAYLERGVRPYVQIGFMPEALSAKPQPYRHHWTPTMKYDEIFTGWAYPPKDYAKWDELVFRWVMHCVEKYGRNEVETWYWEVWNESNAGYWRGKPEEFLKLHDYAIDGVRRALPTAKVGGADTAGSGGKFSRAFIEHCLRGTNYVTGKIGTPLDFVSFHAKGAPKFVDGHVQMGIANQLRTIDDGFRIIASYPEAKRKPIIIGESDPDGCAACQGAQLGYRNTTMYSSYTAASFARKYALADRHGVNLEGALTWAFEFEDQPYFAGFRVLASNGIDLPVLNVFRMFAKMSGQRVAVESTGEVNLDSILKSGIRENSDVSALASEDGNRLFVLVWNYHDDDVPGPDTDVELNLAGWPAGKIEQYRIDAEHSNAYEVWRKMGSPQQPTPEQYAQLEAAGQLASVAGSLRFKLPRQAVWLLVIERK